MKYMVMETHPGYAVVLDEKGDFLKVTNFRYEVGQTVTDVEPLRLPETAAPPVRQNRRRWISTLTTLAACLVLVLSTVFFSGRQPYASVYMTINPQVRIDVDKKDIVVGLEGVNADGITLIEGYTFRNKDLDTVVDELVDRAIEEGFLKKGGAITLSLEADDTWVETHRTHLEVHVTDHLNHLEDPMDVTVAVGCRQDDDHDDPDDYDDDEDHDDDEDRDDDDHDDGDDHDDDDYDTDDPDDHEDDGDFEADDQDDNQDDNQDNDDHDDDADDEEDDMPGDPDDDQDADDPVREEDSDSDEDDDREDDADSDEDDDREDDADSDDDDSENEDDNEE